MCGTERGYPAASVVLRGAEFGPQAQLAREFAMHSDKEKELSEQLERERDRVTAGERKFAEVSLLMSAAVIPVSARAILNFYRGRSLESSRRWRPRSRRCRSVHPFMLNWRHLSQRCCGFRRELCAIYGSNVGGIYGSICAVLGSKADVCGGAAGDNAARAAAAHGRRARAARAREGADRAGAGGRGEGERGAEQ
eukprot:3895446-Rhodomonas_salina.1